MMEFSDISQIRYSFRLNWTIPLTKFLEPKTTIPTTTIPEPNIFGTRSTTTIPNPNIFGAKTTTTIPEPNDFGTEITTTISRPNLFGTKTTTTIPDSNIFGTRPTTNSGFTFGIPSYIAPPSTGIFCTKSNAAVDLELIDSSGLYDFKDIKLCPFYLELRRHRDGLKLIVKTRTGGNNSYIELQHAFVVIKERIFYVGVPKKSILSYLCGQELQYSVLRKVSTEVKEVTIHCRISGTAEIRCSFSNTILNENNTFVGRETITCEEIAFKSSLCSTGDTCWETTVSSTASEAVAKYLSSGELPDLDVNLAKQLLVEAAQQGIVEMKALSTQYLMAKLTVDNVVDLLNLSTTHGIRDLQLKCVEYLTKKCSVQMK